MSHNIKEIALLAGVSKSTASRVISGKGYASAEVRERVLSVVERLQYKPNAVARAMVAKRTHDIGVIVFRDRQPIVSHPLYGKLIDAILMAAEARGYSVFLKTDQEMSLRSTDYMLERRVDGLILISRLRKNVIDYVKKFNLPYLMVNGSTDDPDVIHLVSNDEEGGERAAAYLHGRGHRKFFVIAGPQEHRSHNLRLTGFRRGLDRFGQIEAAEVVYSSESDFEYGSRLMSAHWEAFARGGYTALFTTNDMLALGAMKVLQARAVAVPGQVAVMGFDNVAYAGMHTPSLTTVRVDTDSMGRDAVDMLDRLIRQEEDLPKLIEYASELIVREST
ncbi:LacI family DNA-binding transcriptional regulator [Cohnella nanjingensis]|uniref:LacI family DNA-binding transcriptional regulator n=1 Tax=Cohnella nanjingensis TaxID=1387779 RepID=A0A7X0RRH4_9BACL|nr:LacI family DNA-binding transcriptional regulator [Cohnella nanjingensis]MBB6671176.1 LacI family DNA-binding transcriptional regulator [Cohnella nanjingensis]